MAEYVPRLSEAFEDVEGLYVNAEYRELARYRFRHDHKPHHHSVLSGLARQGESPLKIRHWTIQDVYDSQHVRETIRLAAAYGMNGIQFSGDNVYWVNDSLFRYNTYVHTGMLCELCHDAGLKAYFWTHEINDFFHEYVTGGQYGFYGQLAGGVIDLSSASGFWDALYEKYDVFFRRLKGVDGLVLTLNESHVPVFRDDRIESDLTAPERVAKIGKVVKAACDAHHRDLILRTFSYGPDEALRICDGVKSIGPDLTVMVKCVPHDWQTFYPHNPLIEAFADHPRVVEFDLAHEPMGAGRFPYPDVDHLGDRFDHLVAQGVEGVAGRIDRFRNHAAGTLNWANVYSFSRLAHDPSVPSGQLREEYAEADFGADNKPFITEVTRRLYQAGQHTFFLGKEWGSVHSNLLAFDRLEQDPLWNRAVWMPGSAEAADTVRRLSAPGPEFIEQIVLEKEGALEDLRRLAEEIEQQRGRLSDADYSYLARAVARSVVLCEALTLQHIVVLMVRHDVALDDADRLYTAEIRGRLLRLRALAGSHSEQLRQAGNEGCQYGPEMIERFCRNARRHLQEGRPSPKRPGPREKVKAI